MWTYLTRLHTLCVMFQTFNRQNQTCDFLFKGKQEHHNIKTVHLEAKGQRNKPFLEDTSFGTRKNVHTISLLQRFKIQEVLLSFHA